MKNKPFQTGVRRLNMATLWNKIKEWTDGNGCSLNALQALTARSGIVVHATTLHKVRDGEIKIINPDSLHTLLKVIEVSFEDVSEPLD